jgi:hypothetical protein
MSVRSCKVTIQDMDGVNHTVEVTAATFYEAVALGMAAIRTDEWVNGIAQGLNPVKVRVTNVPVEILVSLVTFLTVIRSRNSIGNLKCEALNIYRSPWHHSVWTGTRRRSSA